jgi:hypothetical protein
VKNRAWVRNPIDAFILARLEKEDIKPSPEADRRTLIRRLSLDLLGLLPTPAEVQAFVNDTRPDAYERLVDRLLASLHFGERWGRHWLDLARYADSDGYEKDLPRPYAYVYRDWVIDAFNKDMPFDQFTIEQLAGDVVWAMSQRVNGSVNESTSQRVNESTGKQGIDSLTHLPVDSFGPLIATGFHRQTLTNREGGVDQEEFRIKAVKDRVDTTGTVWLGLSVACAQCHNHKYDPITQKEYYRLFAFFNGDGEVDLPLLPPNEREAYEKAKKFFDEEQTKLKAALAIFEKERLPARLAAWEKSVKLPDAQLPAAIAEILAIPAERRSETQKAELTKYYRALDAEWAKRNDAVTEHAKKAPAEPTKAMTLMVNANPPQSHLHERGDFLRKGEEVQPGALAVLNEFKPANGKPNRLDLARWIVDPQNPLTARVTVNRVWQNLFGQGLVTTTNNFGTRGEKPSHPELLDWLATAFVSTGQRVNGSMNESMSQRGNESMNGSTSQRVSGSTKKQDIDSLTHLPIDPYRCGWSRKALIKLIVTSATYRQSSHHRADLAAIDPNNALLARQNRFRVEAEIVRDLSLSVSGLLDLKRGGASVVPPFPKEMATGQLTNEALKMPTGTHHRRGVYVHVQRTLTHPSLAAFDATDGNQCCVRRDRSTTPTQALTLLNDPVFAECAAALGKRLLKMNAPRDERLAFAFRLCLSRPPSAAERAVLVELVERQQQLGATADAVWTGVARTLLNLEEFTTRE